MESAQTETSLEHPIRNLFRFLLESPPSPPASDKSTQPSPEVSVQRVTGRPRVSGLRWTRPPPSLWFRRKPKTVCHHTPAKMVCLDTACGQGRLMCKRCYRRAHSICRPEEQFHISQLPRVKDILKWQRQAYFPDYLARRSRAAQNIVSRLTDPWARFFVKLFESLKKACPQRQGLSDDDFLRNFNFAVEHPDSEDGTFVLRARPEPRKIYAQLFKKVNDRFSRQISAGVGDAIDTLAFSAIMKKSSNVSPYWRKRIKKMVTRKMLNQPLMIHTWCMEHMPEEDQNEITAQLEKIEFMT